MNVTGITCAQVDERDLDTRYLARLLRDEEAEAFEAHYFACDRCWNLVRLGNEVHATLRKPGVASGIEFPDRSGWLARRRWLALAAMLAIVSAGLSFWRSPLHSRGPTESTRGRESTLPVRAVGAGASVAAVWPRVAGAAVYRVRLFSPEGDLLLQREVADTSLAVAPAALPSSANSDSLYWMVEALDSIYVPIAHSGLVAQPAPRRAP